MKKKVKRNKKYIEQQVERNDLFIVPLNTRTMVSHVNKKYGVPGDKKVLSKTSLLRYHNERIKERKKIGSARNSAHDVIEHDAAAHKSAAALETRTSKWKDNKEQNYGRSKRYRAWWFR